MHLINIYYGRLAFEFIDCDTIKNSQSRPEMKFPPRECAG